jgi:uncharacterized membrane protein YhaH (DUF805 family)
MILAIVAFAVSAWMFVELGFLPGTVGPNEHGADDPLSS